MRCGHEARGFTAARSHSRERCRVAQQYREPSSRLTLRRSRLLPGPVGRRSQNRRSAIAPRDTIGPPAFTRREGFGVSCACESCYRVRMSRPEIEFLGARDIAIGVGGGTPDAAELCMLTGLRFEREKGRVRLTAPRLANGERAIPDMTGKSPLVVFEHGRRAWEIHYDCETYTPIEVDLETITVEICDTAEGRTRSVSHDCHVYEVVHLHGARFVKVDR